LSRNDLGYQDMTQILNMLHIWCIYKSIHKEYRIWHNADDSLEK